MAGRTDDWPGFHLGVCVALPRACARQVHVSWRMKVNDVLGQVSRTSPGFALHSHACHCAGASG
eukprot:14068130-Alexandrium_andersonii.AAC.1